MDTPMGIDDGLTAYPEFSGTLMGFDDYVSKSSPRSFYSGRQLTRCSDMVLEDVTELYVNLFVAGRALALTM
jgi:hypothetical protein